MCQKENKKRRIHHPIQALNVMWTDRQTDRYFVVCPRWWQIFFQKAPPQHLFHIKNTCWQMMSNHNMATPLKSKCSVYFVGMKDFPFLFLARGNDGLLNIIKWKSYIEIKKQYRGKVIILYSEHRNKHTSLRKFKIKNIFIYRLSSCIRSHKVDVPSVKPFLKHLQLNWFKFTVATHCLCLPSQRTLSESRSTQFYKSCK